MNAPPSGGPKRRLVFLCESGTDVRLVEGLARSFQLTLLLRPAFNGREVNWPVAEGVEVRIERGPSGRASFAGYAALWLQRHRTEIDAVLVQNVGLSTVAANVAKLVTGTPTLALVCSPTTAYFKCKWRKRQINRATYLAGLGALESMRALNGLLMDHYVVLSEHLGKSVARDGPSRSSVIPLYGVDTEQFRPVSREERNALRRSLSLPLEAFVIFFSSRISPEKDTETLLLAARKLKERNVPLMLVNMSGGHGEFRRQASALGLEELVRAQDAVHPTQALAEYYQAADLCVQASVEEGLGFSPLEALACETPVIATAVGGLTETIREGETGLTVPVGDAEALAERITYAFEHPDEMREMARRGRVMVQARYRADTAFSQFRRLIEASVSGAALA